MLNAITLDDLKPFPLPQHLSVLPESVLREFSDQYELVQGYLKSLSSFQQRARVEVESELSSQIAKLNQCIKLLAQYNQVSSRIESQIKQMNDYYNEWINLETIQYQLLSSNFNQDVLKRKFEKLISESEAKLVAAVRKFKSNQPQTEAGYTDMVEKFRQERKTYHLRKEKLNRWNEERVTGFM